MRPRAPVTAAVFGGDPGAAPISARPVPAAALRAHAPVVRLHPREPFWPAAPADYIAGADLRGPGAGAVAGAAGLYEYYAGLAAAGGAGPAAAPPALHPRPAAIRAGLFSGARAGGAAALAATPAYVVVQEFPDRPGLVYLTYVLFFAYNGDYPILGGLVKAGAHPADIERFTVELEPAPDAGASGASAFPFRARRYYFGAHGDADGTWRAAAAVETEGDRPVVYAALRAHALYPRAGRVWRYLGFANDRTAAGGPRWDPPLVRVLPEGAPGFDPATMGWAFFGGNWEPAGIAGVVRKAWFARHIAASRDPWILGAAGVWGLRAALALAALSAFAALAFARF